MFAGHRDNGADRDARRVPQVHQHLRHAAVALFRRSGAAEQDHVLGSVGEAGPDLGAVDDIAAPDFRGLGLDRCEIGPNIRLAHADGEIRLPGGDAGQQGLALFLGPDAQDQRAGLAVGDPVQRDGRAGGEHFFQHHIAFQSGALVTAVFLRPGHTDPAFGAHRAAEILVHAGPGFGPLHRLAMGEMGFQEVAHFLPQGFGGGGRGRGREAESGHRRRFLGKGYRRVARGGERGQGGANISVAANAEMRTTLRAAIALTP